MQIAVTGGRGHIGRAVTALALSPGHTVVSIDRAPPDPAAAQAGLTCLAADLTDYHAFEQALRGCDALVHLAAIPAPGKHPDHLVHNNNVIASYNALSAAATLAIRHVCQASSVNATGAVFSRRPRYDYFPLDEQHPTYNEDAYSLSKWLCEQQADSIARRNEAMTIASLRFHGLVPDRAARACLLSLAADFAGHHVFYIVAPDTVMDAPSLELKARFYPHVPLRADLAGNQGFYDCRPAGRLLGWRHDD